MEETISKTIADTLRELLDMLGKGEAWSSQTLLRLPIRLHLWVRSPLLTGFNEKSKIDCPLGAQIETTPADTCKFLSSPGRFESFPYHLVPESVRQLVEDIKSKSTSRGCGPVLWKWALAQPWSH